MKICSVYDAEFAHYGRVHSGIESAALLREMEKIPLPESGTAYEPSIAALEACEAFADYRTSVFGGMLPFIIVFAVMIFFMFRSQKKQQQKRQQMLDQIVKGSRVILGSGIYGTVVEVREKTFVVEIADKVQIEVLKGGVSEVAVDAADGKESKDK